MERRVPPSDAVAVPPVQYLSAEHVVGEMADAGIRRIQVLSVPQIVMLAMLGGAFVTVGPSSRCSWLRERTAPGQSASSRASASRPASSS
jgi:hypothetical protein